MMLAELAELLHLDQMGLRAVADILVLTVIVYQLLLLIRGTRAVQMILGILFLGVVYFLTGPGHMLELPAVHRVLGVALFFLPFVIVVLFQNHIRRVLSSFGRNPLRGLSRTAAPAGRIADEIVLAVTSLASLRQGALIVIEGEQGLRTFAETGIRVDGVTSYDLLMTIFLPRSPLHDGAVIIGEGRVKAASCYLPLTMRPRLSKQFGSRHRAAIGITEETDATAIVVSEERGTVSLARRGAIREEIGADELREVLDQLLPAPKPLPSWLPWGSAATPDERMIRPAEPSRPERPAAEPSTPGEPAAGGPARAPSVASGPPSPAGSAGSEP